MFVSTAWPEISQELSGRAGSLTIATYVWNIRRFDRFVDFAKTWFSICEKHVCLCPAIRPEYLYRTNATVHPVCAAARVG